MSNLRKINISIVIPSLETGGAESMAYQLSESIDKTKFNINFICLYSSSGAVFERKLAQSGVKLIFLEKKLGLSIPTFFKLWKKLNGHHTDIVHTHLGACLYAAPWSIFYKKKLLHTVHNMPLKEIPSAHRLVLKIMYKTGMAVPIAISNIIQKQISRTYNLETEKVQVIYNPVNLNNLYTKTFNETNKTITFVCVARLAAQKNHKLLLKAFSFVQNELQNTTLLLAGDGELLEDLKKEAKQLNINEHVHFLGNTDNIPEILNQSDIFVLSSNYEGLPMTILEAMGSALPIIATRVGGVPDIVKENGVLVEANDYKGLAKAMICLAEDKQLREEMGKKGLEIAKNYDIITIAKQYEELYRRHTS